LNLGVFLKLAIAQLVVLIGSQGHARLIRNSAFGIG